MRRVNVDLLATDVTPLFHSDRGTKEELVWIPLVFIVIGLNFRIGHVKGSGPPLVVAWIRDKTGRCSRFKALEQFTGDLNDSSGWVVALRDLDGAGDGQANRVTLNIGPDFESGIALTQPWVGSSWRRSY